MLKSRRSSRFAAGLMTAALLGAAVPGVSAQRAIDSGRTKGTTKTEAPTAAFTAGNVVICRVGDGAAALTANATPVFLDEYTTAGVLVQSLAVPTVTAGARLTMTGNSTTECELNRSEDGRYLVITGYDAAVGTVTPATTASATIPRVIGRVDSSGAFNLSTSTTSFSAQNIRSAISIDGTSFWAVGSGTGLVFQPLGGSGAGTIVTTDLTNSRAVNIFQGQLYTSSGSGALRMNSVGTGVPTTGPQPTTSLPGLPTATVSNNDFFFADLSPAIAGYDTLYVTDDQSVGAGTVRKYTFDGTTWNATGTAAGNAQYRGLTGRVSGGVVTLLATRGGNELVSISDATGYNGTMTAAPVSVVTAAVNTGLRGVALAPLATTAAGVSISGRVITSEGRGVRNANVTISGGGLQNPITLRSGRFGQFVFNDIPAGQTYVVTVTARRFSFSSNSRVIEVNDNVADLNFIATDMTDR